MQANEESSDVSSSGSSLPEDGDSKVSAKSLLATGLLRDIMRPGGMGGELGGVEGKHP